MGDCLGISPSREFYVIPTNIPDISIPMYIDAFLKFASWTPQYEFHVHEEFSRFYMWFTEATDNIHLPETFTNNPSNTLESLFD